jgi:hypothetical protein
MGRRQPRLFVVDLQGAELGNFVLIRRELPEEAHLGAVRRDNEFPVFVERQRWLHGLGVQVPQLAGHAAARVVREGAKFGRADPHNDAAVNAPEARDALGLPFGAVWQCQLLYDRRHAL